MCDFHSIMVSYSGKIYHLPSNSHSDISRKYQLEFIDCYEIECDPTDILESLPSFDGIKIYIRQYQRDHWYYLPNIVQQKVVNHYIKLTNILRTGRLVPPFNNKALYSDVLVKLAELGKRKRTKVDNEITYYNSQGQLHRLNGPAFIDLESGHMSYYVNGELHRNNKGKPAMICPHRKEIIYFKKGKLIKVANMTREAKYYAGKT